MRLSKITACTLGLVFMLGLPELLTAKTVLRVPSDFSTIQAAVDAASPGDQIRVGPGEWCGATIDKQVGSTPGLPGLCPLRPRPPM